jgi:NADPH:quinone reductase-like Zn-dependent oxidoreductase
VAAVKAAVARGINETDPLSMLELRDDWPDLIAPDGHTLVRVGATSMNMHDLWTLRGVGVRADQFPLVLGCDIAGWADDGSEVIVSGSFGRPDAGRGDESFDPNRALVFYRQISIIGVSGASRAETEQLLRLMEAADLHPVIDSVYPFEQIHAAFERAQCPDLFGKVVLRVGTP